MKEQPRQEIHDGTDVWVNPTTESLRGEECLCLNCGVPKFNQLNVAGRCPIAQISFDFWLEKDVAITVTRCPLWKPKIESKPKEKVRVT